MKNLAKIWGFLMNHHVYRIVNLIIYIFYFVPSDYGIDYIPYLVSFFWGITLLVWDFFTKRLMFKQSYWYILFALCISYILSIVTNLSAALVPMGMNFVYLAFSVFIFYVIDPRETQEEKNNKFQKMNDVFIVITFVLSIISLLTFVLNISFITAEGLRQGFIENRLFGVFTSPNIGSMFGYTSIMLMLINNYFKRGSWKKFQKFYIANGIIQYLYFVLSSSRGTRIAVITFFVFYFIITSILILYNQKQKYKQIIRSAFLLVGVLTSLTYANQFTSFTLSYVPGFVDNVTQGSDRIDTEILEDEVPDRLIKRVVISHSEDGSEVSSGRLTIWEAGHQLVKQKPVFGVADSYVYRNGELAGNIDEGNLSEINKSELVRAHGNMHNTYVAVLVKAGISGFVILSIFIVCILKDSYIFIKDNKNDFNDENIQMYIIILAFLLSLFANDLVENHLIFNNRDVMGLIFWSYLSYLNHFRKAYSSKESAVSNISKKQL